MTFLTRKLDPNYIKNSQNNSKKNKSKIRKKILNGENIRTDILPKKIYEMENNHMKNAKYHYSGK